MEWLTDISLVDKCLMIALLGVFVYQMYFYGRYIFSVPMYERRRVARRAAAQQAENVAEPSQPGVSILVCARNEGDNLEHYLHSLLTQEYPRYEVIVVNDGSEDNTQAVLDNYHKQYPHLKLSFVPKEARVGSSKKLGLTLAAKAAQYDYLLLTDADCRPASPHWISAMMEGMTPDKDIVLGYGGYFVEHGALNRMIRFDTLFNGLHFLGAAITGRPYMGVGRNLLYRKSLFFSIGGFSHQMTSRAGDDDLFVNQVATHQNTAVVCSRDSVTWSISKQSWSDWMVQKRRHLSVSPRYRLASRVHLTLEPLSRGLFYALLIAIAVLSPLPVICAAAVLWLIRLLVQWIGINIGAYLFGQGHIGIIRLVWDIFLPVINLYILLTNSIHKPTRWS